MAMNPTPVELSSKAHRRQNLFRFFSPKTGRMVELESFVEFIVWLFFEFRQDVTFLCERPGYLEHRNKGRVSRYLPDIFVRLIDGYEFLVESKKDEDLVLVIDECRVPRRWPIIKEIVDHAGIPIELMTDRKLVEHATAVANWRQALPYAAGEAQRPRHELRKLVKRRFEVESVLTIGELAADIADWEETDVCDVAFWYVHQGALSIDWDASDIGRHTVLRRKNDGPGEAL
ncbi:MAG: hypothetical protein OEQ39_25195 [Gammaproteobacteria bacterium]|nr:hypothetical protein [Gammaproteobacteria bacterium]